MNKETSMQMKRRWIVTIAVLLLSIAIPVSGHMESDKYIIPKSTISSGGSVASSGGFNLTATIGQTSCIGRSSRGAIVLHAGFWAPEEFDVRPKALPFIPLLLLNE